MHFKTAAIATLLSVAAALPAPADQTSCVDNAVTVLDNLSSGAKALQGQVEDFTPSALFSTFPRIINGFNDELGGLASLDLNCGGELSADDQKKVCAATENLIVANEDLVKSLGAKQAIIGQTPFGGPLSAVVRSLEATLDPVVFSAINAAPVCAGDLEKLETALAKDVEAVVGQLQL
ncbi:uncharacterized protein DSM5745_04394 [Aspergillus mulundensis]|uniref:Cell wall galactomannoprotein n=1 Tax=Aspergillus mulundensis TaxID=1810919 RepID=A0A3D8SE86_9EURO|nr:hypothetical protein DSM5745_04394 [Aspergillus mulundensis]RDW84068.1 hypothetical protein DSM5745_04394 [Aspergillus mulundensis]